MRTQTRWWAIAGVAALGAVALLWNQAVRAERGAEGEPTRVAVIDVLGTVQRLFESERYKPARDEFEAKLLTETVQPARAAMTDLKARYDALAPDSPDRARLSAEYDQKSREVDLASTFAEEFNTRQLAEAYRVVIETAGSVAKERGYTMVVASRTDRDFIKGANVNTAVQEMLARPVLVAPEGADITTAVTAALKLDAAMAPASPPASPSVAPQTPPGK